MKFNDIVRLDPDDYFKWFIFGKSTLRANFNQIRTNHFEGMPDPTFFLSTGRCGTRWFAFLLSKDKSLRVFHEPKPNFGVQGKVAYEIYTSKNFTLSKNEDILLKEIFLTGREQYLRYSYKTQKRFIETNNQISFLAPAIYNLFPNAKFVHINRHPGDFIRSALRRKFYNNRDDIKRIVPQESNQYSNDWSSLSFVGKNAWLWAETNAFIESFKEKYNPKHFFYFDFSNLNSEQVTQLTDFLDVKIPKYWINKYLKKPVNAQKVDTITGYEEWNEADKLYIANICGDMADQYNYTL